MYDQYTQFLRASPSLGVMFKIIMGFNLYLITLPYVKEKVCDIDDHNTKHVAAPKGTKAVYLNPNLQHH